MTTTTDPKRVLIVGGGGREHALASAIAGSPLCAELFCTPGNDGIARVCKTLSSEYNLEHWVRMKAIDLVIFGPEQPLVDGEGDKLREITQVFGPSAAAAMLEGSKTFMKDIAVSAGVPTAGHQAFDASQIDEALAYVADQGAPIVVKASGLAAGKGVVVAETLDQALDATRDCLSGDAFGDAGHQVVIEECMVGPEVSVFHLVQDGKIKLLGAAQDHKRLHNDDQGPNTGGMGTFSPSPLFTPELAEIVERDMVLPTLAEMERRGCPFEGFLFTGIMLTDGGPKLLEYNVRMGDPETQSLLPLLSSDLLTAILDSDAQTQLGDQHAVTVVLAAPGYPTSPVKGLSMPVLPEDTDDVRFTVAGARQDDAGDWQSSGGRVLGVTGIGQDHEQAKKSAYDAVAAYGWADAHYRTDIGEKNQ